MFYSTLARQACVCSAALLWLLGGQLANAAQNPSDSTPTATGLHQFINEALNNNPGIASAQAAVEAATSIVQAADRPLYNPELRVGAEQAETRAASVGLGQTIDWSDKRGARTNVASAELRTTQAEYDGIRQRLTGELLSALATYHTSKARQQLAQKRIELTTDLLNLSQQRRTAGDLSQIELDLSGLAHTQAALQLSLAATDLAEAEQNLAAVTGSANGDWPTLPQNIPELGPFDARNLLLALPQLRASQYRVDAARALVSLRQRERRPDPTIGASIGQERTFRNGGDEDFGLIGLNLSIPLFVRNSFRAEVQTANSELTVAQQTFQDSLRRAEARLLSAADRYRLSREAWQAWLTAGRPNLRSQISQLNRIWKYGEMSTADYLVQLNQTLETRNSALEVQNRLWDAWADWLVASGRVDTWMANGKP